MTMKLTKHQQEMLDGKQGDDGLFQTPPADSALPAGIDRRSFDAECGHRCSGGDDRRCLDT